MYSSSRPEKCAAPERSGISTRSPNGKRPGPGKYTRGGAKASGQDKTERPRSPFDPPAYLLWDNLICTASCFGAFLGGEPLCQLSHLFGLRQTTAARLAEMRCSLEPVFVLRIKVHSTRG